MLAHSGCSSWLPSPPHRRGPYLKSLGSTSCIALGSSEAWQPGRSPRALNAYPGGFPRKLAFRLVSAEPGLRLPTPLLAIGKFPVPLWPDVCKAVSWQPEARLMLQTQSSESFHQLRVSVQKNRGAGPPQPCGCVIPILWVRPQQ